ncbi:MAG: BrnT family toxin [Nitrospirales bacterium]|nr:BrnT family toxin [Nitrospirales bacterium]
MVFEWDDDKQEGNLKKHGVDFLDVVRIFANPVLEWIDTRQDYGEERTISIGFTEEDYFVVVSTWRRERRRINSAWKAGRDEKEKYHHHHA